MSDTAMQRPGTIRRAFRHRSFAIGAFLTGLVVLAAAVSYVWTPYSAIELAVPRKLRPPSADHLSAPTISAATSCR